MANQTIDYTALATTIATAVAAAQNNSNNNSNTGSSAVREFKEAIELLKNINDGSAAGEAAVQKVQNEYNAKVTGLVSAGQCPDETAAKALLAAIGVNAPTSEYLDQVRKEAEAEDIEKNAEAFEAGLGMMATLEAARNPIGTLGAFSQLTRMSESQGTYNNPMPSARPRTYYTAREQYESHRDITLRNSSAKRGASAAERLDCNLNAFSEHLEVFARKFKR